MMETEGPSSWSARLDLKSPRRCTSRCVCEWECFQRGLAEEGGATLGVGGTAAWAGSLDWMKIKLEQKASWAPTFIFAVSPSLLPFLTMESATSHSSTAARAALTTKPWWTVPSNSERNTSPPFFKSLCPAWHFVTTMRQVAQQWGRPRPHPKTW